MKEITKKIIIINFITFLFSMFRLISFLIFILGTNKKININNDIIKISFILWIIAIISMIVLGIILMSNSKISYNTKLNLWNGILIIIPFICILGIIISLFSILLEKNNDKKIDLKIN